MPNNRSLIDNADIVRPAQLLEKGLPIPGLSGYYDVDEGWCAVITEGGMFREILPPGHHRLSKYSLFRDIKATVIDTRLQTLNVNTTGEFTIAQPVTVPIDLHLAVEYRVCDARRLATEVKTPLTSLYDRVLQAVRSIIAFANIDEIRTQGEGIARGTLQRLQAMQLPTVVGIEVFSVLVSLIKVSGNDPLAAQQLKEYTTVRDWQMNSAMTQQSKMTWEWLLQHRPEIAQQMIATHGMLAKEMIDKGLLDPAGFLNQPTTSGGSINPMQMLGGGVGSGMPGLGMLGSAVPGTTQPPPPGLNEPPRQLTTVGDIQSRVREEVAYLERLPGATVETKPGTNQRGIPDGSYDLRVSLPRSSGGVIVLYLTCLAAYPQAVPLLDIEVDDQPTPFQSAILRRWNGQYLVEIAREVKQFFG